MKFLQYSGLLFFLLALGLFMFLPVLTVYEVDPEGITQVGKAVKDQHREMIVKELQLVNDETVRHKMGFVRKMNGVMEEVNRHIEVNYSPTPERTSAWVEAVGHEADGKWQISQAGLDSANNQLPAAIAQTVKDYTGWLAGRSYDSEDALQTEAKSAFNNAINSLIGQKQISDYDQDEYLFAMTRNFAKGLFWDHKLAFFWVILGLGTLGGLVYQFPAFYDGMPGIKHNGIYFRSLTRRGLVGILLGAFLIGFYILLYFVPWLIVEWVAITDPIAQLLRGEPAGRWFMYGLLYTVVILVMGVRMFAKYRHSRYHQIRTASVMFFQLAFAFLIPQILFTLNLPEADLKNIWPLNYTFFFDWNIQTHIQSGTIGIFMLVWGIILAVVGVPLLTYFYGKRWYCSWVCGCGGLAETLGDPFRQLSDKRLVAWQVERWLVHGVLVFAVGMTGMVLYTYFTGSSTVLGLNSYSIRGIYGFAIGSIFAGVVGTGFYPLMGNRVWCRFGCPLAAYLGIVQRFKSRFRITTNGGQCISCGNCSTYCEQGIDVRWYAQRGQNIVRASCVGCGVCASVCPRGVLALENGPDDGKSRMEEVRY